VQKLPVLGFIFLKKDNKIKDFFCHLSIRVETFNLSDDNHLILTNEQD